MTENVKLPRKLSEEREPPPPRRPSHANVIENLGVGNSMVSTVDQLVTVAGDERPGQDRADAELDLTLLTIPENPDLAFRQLVAYQFNNPESKRALEVRYYMAVAQIAAISERPTPAPNASPMPIHPIEVAVASRNETSCASLWSTSRSTANRHPMPATNATHTHSSTSSSSPVWEPYLHGSGRRMR